MAPTGSRPPLPRPQRPPSTPGDPMRALPPSRASGSPPTSNTQVNGHAAHYASWDDLVRAAPLPERDLELPGGLVVRLRKLSRAGQHEIQARALVDGREDTALGERLLLRYCVVDPPVPDDAAAEHLQHTLDSDVLQTIVDVVKSFSGLGPAEVAAADAAFPAPDAG